MKNAKSSATLLGVGLLLIVVALLVVSYSMGPTVVEKPVVVRQYVEERVPVYVQPSWWGFYGAPWGAHTAPWKIGSGLPGMKVPGAGPSHPATGPSQPAIPPPAPPAPAAGPSQPANPPPPAA